MSSKTIRLSCFSKSHAFAFKLCMSFSSRPEVLFGIVISPHPLINCQKGLMSHVDKDGRTLRTAVSITDILWTVWVFKFCLDTQKAEKKRVQSLLCTEWEGCWVVRGHPRIWSLLITRRCLSLFKGETSFLLEEMLESTQSNFDWVNFTCEPDNKLYSTLQKASAYKHGLQIANDLSLI